MDKKEAQRHWILTKSILKTKLHPDIFNQLIDPLCIHEVREKDWVLVPEPSAKGLNIDEVAGAYKGLIEHTLRDMIGTEVDVTPMQAPQDPILSTVPRFGSQTPIDLNPEFTFEQFVVGSNSQFAFSACWAVANGSGGTQFNPLLIYGGVGLGKTHLLHAIGNFILQNNKMAKIRYTTSEAFYREFVDSIRDNKITELSNYYRTQVDVLLMDDIQFLSGKDRTQEEFFHIFNALHQVGKQIVLTSDNPPNQLKGLEDRLISRFQWGLFVDVQAPDRETREAILKKKARLLSLDIPNEIISFLAEAIEDNVRILEGAVRQLMLQASLQTGDMTLEFAREIVSRISNRPSKPININDIADIVAEYFSVEIDRILERGRGSKEVAQARQVAMFLMKELTSASLETIGKRFGDRDHSTVVHAIKTIRKNMERDNSFKRHVDGIMQRLNRHG